MFALGCADVGGLALPGRPGVSLARIVLRPRIRCPGQRSGDRAARALRSTRSQRAHRDSATAACADRLRPDDVRDGGGVEMNADDVLIEDHNRLRGLLSQLKSTTTDDSERRRELLDQLVAVLTVHVQIEDELFYPAIAEVSTLLGQSHAQHRQIDDQLAVVLRTDPASKDFAVVELDDACVDARTSCRRGRGTDVLPGPGARDSQTRRARRAHGASTSATFATPG